MRTCNGHDGSGDSTTDFVHDSCDSNADHVVCYAMTQVQNINDRVTQTA